MKSANEENFKCNEFNEHIREYIDDELSGTVKADFIAHASHCKDCNNNLREMKRVRSILSNLKPVSTSPEFNFILKARMRFENNRLRNPFYRLKLFFEDNARAFIAIPALALVILATVFLYSYSTGNLNSDNTLQNVTIMSDSQNGVELAGETEDIADEIVYVYYVLETVRPNDIETGIFLNNHPVDMRSATDRKPINLISF